MHHSFLHHNIQLAYLIDGVYNGVAQCSRWAWMWNSLAVWCATRARLRRTSTGSLRPLTASRRQEAILSDTTFVLGWCVRVLSVCFSAPLTALVGTCSCGLLVSSAPPRATPLLGLESQAFSLPPRPPPALAWDRMQPGAPERDALVRVEPKYLRPSATAVKDEFAASIPDDATADEWYEEKLRHFELYARSEAGPARPHWDAPSWSIYL